ncbi:S24 family peptidase [Pseudomonas marincola]|uniref:S24 family peptidase n=1 Tax=Pseudomonas marincola TaxID=437900 RepID=UPI000B84AD1F|nr:S24 family peptidase [Pseudomonas marincola]
MTKSNSGDRLRKVIHDRNLSKAAVAASLGLAPQNLQNWFVRGVPARQMKHVSAYFRISRDWLECGTGPERADQLSYNSGKTENAGDSAALTPAPEHQQVNMVGGYSTLQEKNDLPSDIITVPFLVEIEMSPRMEGRMPIAVNNEKKFPFSRSQLAAEGINPDVARCVLVSDNSMGPVIPKGSVVGIDTSTIRVNNGDIYAVDHAGQLRVKQLYKLPGGGLRLRSFKRDEHSSEKFSHQVVLDPNDGITIIGRVFWISAFR